MSLLARLLTLLLAAVASEAAAQPVQITIALPAEAAARARAVLAAIDERQT